MEITSDFQEFKESKFPKINYSGENSTALQIKPHGILSDYGIKDYSMEVSNDPNFLKVFFRNNNSPVPFDLFGAAFWLLSRYEEYLPHKADAFNRYQYKSSLAWQYDFLHIPLVNLWLFELKKILQYTYPELAMKERKYNFVSTIDIDNAFKYKYKGFVRTLAGFLNDLAKRNFSRIKERASVLFGKTEDPFDCYEFLIATHRERQIESVFFFLLGDYGPNDKNHPATNLHFQSLIKHLSDYSATGIHPSYGSSGNLHQLKVEISRLNNITHRQVNKSRQHFSVLKFPLSYNLLMQADIQEDYSMGYTNLNGFRASYCYPYRWYSIEDESVTSLLIHPFALSENTVEYYKAREDKTFMELVAPIIREVKKYNGEMVSIFHNNTFNENMKQNYLDFLKEVRSGPK